MDTYPRDQSPAGKAFGEALVTAEPRQVVVFCGPSLTEPLVHVELPKARVHGPAACGDVYRAVRAGSTHIGLIDGAFEHCLSVWHKEILWALSEGVRVYGGASMGALRAAELHPFGMVGVGEIFEAYKSGRIEDDDEVAVLHTDAAHGYSARSDALVNIRATLEKALREAAISQATHDAVLACCKSTFYPNRDLMRAVESTSDISATERHILLSWLRENDWIDRKRLDALQVVRTIRRDLERSDTAQRVNFHFESTDSWLTLRRNVDEPHSRIG